MAQLMVNEVAFCEGYMPPPSVAVGRNSWCQGRSSWRKAATRGNSNSAIAIYYAGRRMAKKTNKRLDRLFGGPNQEALAQHQSTLHDSLQAL